VSIYLSAELFQRFCFSLYHQISDSIISEDKLETILMFPAIGAGCAIASIGGTLAYNSNMPHWAQLSAFLFWVGFVAVTVGCEVIDATSTTVFACFAEEPQRLSDTHPLIFHRFVRISEFSTFRTQRLASY
jgi:hypothetical protein